MPDVLGKEEKEISVLLLKNNYQYNIIYMRNGEGKIVGQEPVVGMKITVEDIVTITVALSDQDFEQKILDQINSKREALDMEPLVFSDKLNQACAILAGENVNSVDLVRPDGREWGTVVSEVSYQGIGLIFNSRDGITTLEDADNKIKYWGDENSPGVLQPEFSKIGMAFSEDGTLLYMAGM